MKSHSASPSPAFQELRSISRETTGPHIVPVNETEMADSNDTGQAGNGTTATQMIVISPAKQDEEDYMLSSPEPVPSDIREDREEKRDSLFNMVAPKRPGQQRDEAATRGSQGNIIHSAEESGSPVPAYDQDHLSMEEHTPSHNIMKSTLKRSQQAWVDPWEAAIQDTFYHKEIANLRPTFDIVNESIHGHGQQLQHLFHSPAQIQEDESTNPEDLELEEEEKAMEENKDAQKFGAWDGVMAGCLLMIFGVIMFLRVGFVVGQAGIVQALLIMGLSATVVALTALSMCAICTNGTILAGGAYYIISRALGPSIGGAIGILFSLGNMFSVSLYLIGFAETLVNNLRDMAGFQIFDDEDGVMDVRIWSNVMLCFVLILAIVGLKYVIKANMLLLVLIVAAIVLLFVGSTYREYTNDEFPNPDYDPSCIAADCASQFISKVVITPKGWTNGNLGDNMGSSYESGEDFWSVLSIFFPAVTGIMAGANISGDLRDPSKDIPKGTLWAIGVSTVVYMLMAVMVGAVTVRYELINNTLVMSYICVTEYLILLGIYAATLSSAIASLVGAPRILQAVARDQIFPWKILEYFAVADKDGNPIRGYFLSFGVAFCCNLIGELNAIAPLISQFFMLTYLLINLACFSLTISKSPGWRPSFKYFNKWTAGFGSFLCLSIMFLLAWYYALIACTVASVLYFYVEWVDPEVNWGAAPQARKYYTAYKSILRLRKTKKHIKNWRPGLLVLVRDPLKRPQLMIFAQTLKKSHGPVFYATVHTGDYRTNIRKFHEMHSLGYLPRNAPKNSKGFYEAVLADSLRSGVQNLFQLVGMGSLRPNTLVIGFKKKWQTDSDEVIEEFVQVMRDTLVMGMGLMVPVGFKRINWFQDEYAPPALNHDVDEYPDLYSGRLNERGGTPGRDFMNTTGDGNKSMSREEGRGHEYQEVNDRSMASRNDHVRNVSPVMTMPRDVEEENKAIFLSQAWSAGQGKDTVIDVWWMIDDGGLCMLIPYIMKLHKFWSRCKLRMLMVAEEDDVQSDISTMKELINQFRLPYEGPLLVPARKAPHPKTVATFEKCAGMKLREVPRPSVVSKWLILSELLFEYSRFSGLNVVTLPIPTKRMKPRAYMALLHMLTDQKRMPPTLIMRGNGESTLTFYSE